jgi:hypothetical protein
MKFVGYQNCAINPGEEDWHAMYKGPETKDSLVSDDTLVERGIAIPLTPTVATWKKMMAEKKA